MTPHEKKSQSLGWSSPVAREAHNLEVVGSNPAPATEKPLAVSIASGFFRFHADRFSDRQAGSSQDVAEQLHGNASGPRGGNRRKEMLTR